jgi:hypothetical protein
MTKPSAVAWPSLGPEFRPQDAKQFTAFLRTLYDSLQNLEPGKLFVPYSTSIPTLTQNGQIAIRPSTNPAGGGTLYFMANSTTLTVGGSTA